MTEEDILWRPDPAQAAASNLGVFMRKVGAASQAELVERADADPGWFHDAFLRHIDFRFYRPYAQVLDDSKGAEWARWCVGGTTNVILNALDRWRGRGAGSANFTMLFSFITPEIAIGVGLFLMVTQLFTSLGLGFRSQVLGLSMYELAYPVIIVRARLLSIGKHYEEAAMDLGASPTRALRRVLLPLLAPAILASVAIVFASAIDNFVISQRLCASAACQTIPIVIYSSARRSPLPSLNALASLTLFTSTILIALAFVAYRRLTAGERATVGTA